MSVLDKFERRFGRFAIRKLTLYIVVVSAAALVADRFFVFGEQPLAFRLALFPQLALDGEFWRFITFIFVPDRSDLFWGIVHLYFIFFVGTYLESNWSPFKLNLYVLCGMLPAIAVSLIFGTAATGAFVSVSLLLAFAALEPEFRIMLFFIIPVKAKWLGWFSGAVIAYNFFMSATWGGRCAVLAQAVNFLVFFGPALVRSARYNRAAYMSKQQYEDAKLGRARQQPGKVLKWRPAPQTKAVKARHKCEECGETEISRPDYEFRYCSRCAGDHEFCMDCLSKHTHRTD